MSTLAAGERLYDCRDAFAEALLDLMRSDPRVVVVVNDSVGSTKVGNISRELPERVFNQLGKAHGCCLCVHALRLSTVLFTLGVT